MSLPFPTLKLLEGQSEKLVGDLAGASLVYQVLGKERVVKVLRMWTHSE